MTLVLKPGWNGLTEPEAVSYVAAVEAADGEELEYGVAKAINDFVVGCKTDEIWDAIKASCILAGARTLNGALVPLTGGAPTNNNFVSADYDRETGLIGDGSTKYLDSNRNNNADPQNNQHMFVYVTQASTVNPNAYIGAGGPSDNGATHLGTNILTNVVFSRNRSTTALNHSTATDATLGSIGMSRSLSGSYVLRAAGTSDTKGETSQTPYDADVAVFWRTDGTGYSDGRLSFYSIGESLDPALLDTRVSNLMTAIGAAIP